MRRACKKKGEGRERKGNERMMKRFKYGKRKQVRKKKIDEDGNNEKKEKEEVMRKR